MIMNKFFRKIKWWFRELYMNIKIDIQCRIDMYKESKKKKWKKNKYMGWKYREAYRIKLWVPMAIKFLESLQGEILSEEEQKSYDNANDKDRFFVFGICPEKQIYINATLRQIKSLNTDNFWGDKNNVGNQVVAQLRTEWIGQELGKEKVKRKWGVVDSLK